MKNNRPFFPGRHQASAGENLKLKAEIHQTQQKMESLLNQFDQVTEPPLIDCCIYELNAVWLSFCSGASSFWNGWIFKKRNYVIRRT